MLLYRSIQGKDDGSFIPEINCNKGGVVLGIKYWLGVEVICILSLKNVIIQVLDFSRYCLEPKRINKYWKKLKDFIIEWYTNEKSSNNNKKIKK